MSVNSLQSQEERGNQFDALNPIRVRACKPLAKGSLSPYHQNDLEGVSGELGSICGHVKNDSPVYKIREREKERDYIA